MKRIHMTTGLLCLATLFAISGCSATKSAETSVTTKMNQHTSSQGKSQEKPHATPPGILTLGNMAPNERLISNTTMKPVELASFIGKKPLILNAWASWCPPCQDETPVFVEMSAKYGTQVQFVGVNMTTLDSIQRAKSFVQKYKIPYPILLDTHGAFYRDYTVIAEPMTYVISPAGKVLSIHVGELSATQLHHLIELAIQKG